MKWVTWEQVGVDRMACAWLIQKYIDQEAEFLFVPAGQQPLLQGAEPFDIPGARFSHHREHCTFHALLQAYDLSDPVLERIAGIVDEADTLQEVTVEPAAMGLDLICRHLGYKDDHEQNAAEWIVYDALYAYCQEMIRQGKPNGDFKE